MTLAARAGSLRTLLLTDAITCIATGALMAFAATPLALVTRIPVAILWYAGLSLFPIAAFMGFVAARARERIAGVWLVIAGNAAWVVASLWLLFESGLDLSALGKTFIGLQAAVVLLLTALEARMARAARAQ